MSAFTKDALNTETSCGHVKATVVERKSANFVARVTLQVLKKGDTISALRIFEISLSFKKSVRLYFVVHMKSIMIRIIVGKLSRIRSNLRMVAVFWLFL